MSFFKTTYIYILFYLVIILSLLTFSCTSDNSITQSSATNALEKPGEIYTYCYYKLSEYSISNNIIGKYYKEHLQITPICLDLAHELQHGKNPNAIFFDHDNYNSLKDIIKIYRNSVNHQEVDIILNFLEADLEKYYNNAKSEIAADFGF